MTTRMLKEIKADPNGPTTQETREIAEAWRRIRESAAKMIWNRE